MSVPDPVFYGVSDYNISVDCMQRSIQFCSVAFITVNYIPWQAFSKQQLCGTNRFFCSFSRQDLVHWFSCKSFPFMKKKNWLLFHHQLIILSKGNIPLQYYSIHIIRLLLTSATGLFDWDFPRAVDFYRRSTQPWKCVALLWCRERKNHISGTSIPFRDHYGERTRNENKGLLHMS